MQITWKPLTMIWRPMVTIVANEKRKMNKSTTILNSKSNIPVRNSPVLLLAKPWVTVAHALFLSLITYGVFDREALDSIVLVLYMYLVNRIYVLFKPMDLMLPLEHLFGLLRGTMHPNVLLAQGPNQMISGSKKYVSCHWHALDHTAMSYFILANSKWCLSMKNPQNISRFNIVHNTFGHLVTYISIHFLHFRLGWQAWCSTAPSVRRMNT